MVRIRGTEQSPGHRRSGRHGCATQPNHRPYSPFLNAWPVQLPAGACERAQAYIQGHRWGADPVHPQSGPAQSFTQAYLSASSPLSVHRVHLSVAAGSRGFARCRRRQPLLHRVILQNGRRRTLFVRLAVALLVSL